MRRHRARSRATRTGRSPTQPRRSPAPTLRYHATGGGHGHVLRGIALASRLAGTGVRVTVAGPARLEPWARACGVDWVPLADPHDAAALPAPDLLLVDVFPRGVVAELAPVLGACPAWLVTRRVRPDFYLHAPVREAIETRFEQVVWTEDPPPELGVLRVPVVRTGPVLLDATPLARDEARAALGVAGDGPLVLALGSGPDDLQARQRRMLVKVTDRIGATLRFVSDTLDGAVRLFPAARWFPAADAIVSAGGYHAFHEIVRSGRPAAFLPQDRPYDDQPWRVRDVAAPAGPEELEATLAALVRSGPGTGVALADGAATLADLVRQRLESGPSRTNVSRPG